MLFNSHIFIFIFLPLCLLGYYSLNHFKLYKPAQVFVVLMSLWFYGYFNISYLPVIIISVAVNYFLYYILKRKNAGNFRKVFFLTGILFNLGILGYFKYTDFAIYNVNAVFGCSIPYLKIVLPHGISFFTFQQLSFVIDSYKGNVPEYDFIEYASFVTFFPQLIAGPIVLHSELIPQFMDMENKKFNWEKFSRGSYQFTLGLAKKVLIADVLGDAVNWGYQILPVLNSTNIILIVFSYTFQLYFDFSGYCDMASGIALMFGIELPVNFNSPYKAVNIGDFWKRWHMTLTRFFTQYVYIPLGGNRKGKVRTYVNVLIVFLVSGLWHGAGYTFIVWGLCHGLALVIYRAGKEYFDKIPKAVSWVINFIYISLLWAVFRAEKLSDAVIVIKKFFAFDFGKINSDIYKCYYNTELQLINKIIPFNKLCSFSAVIIWSVICFAGCLLLKNAGEKAKEFKTDIKSALFTGIILAWCICSLSGVSTFLYFNF